MRLAPIFLTLAATPAFADDAALTGNVLVWHDATFYTDANEGAPAVHVAKLDGARKDNVGRVLPMHVLSTKGDYVEVEPTTTRDCTWSQLTTQDDVAKLHLFVKRDDLAPVLAKSFTKTFADGTKLSLRPGMPMVARDDGRYAFSLRGNVIVTDVPSTAIGLAYTPDRSRALSVSNTEYVLATGTQAKLGDQTFAPTNLRASGLEKTAATTMFIVEDRCATVQLAVPPKSVTAATDDDTTINTGSTGHGLLELRDQVFLPPKTPLSIAGHQVAVAAKPIYLPGKAFGKQACIARRLRLEADFEPNTDVDDDSLRLCAPAASVAAERMRSARSAHGSTSR